MPHVSLSLAAFTLAAGCSPYLSVYGLAYRGQAHSGARNQPVVTDGAFRMNGHRLRRSETVGEHLRDVRRFVIRDISRQAPDNDVVAPETGQIIGASPFLA